MAQEQEQQATLADRLNELLGSRLARSAFMAEDSSRKEKHWIQHLQRQQQQQQAEQQGVTEHWWEVLYSQYGSDELRREFYEFRVGMGIRRPMHRLSAQRKAELLIEDMTETLAFSSPDERAKLHADWEWDLDAQSDKTACPVGLPHHLRPYSWREGWSWEVQSKKRRARALSSLDVEFALLAEQSTETYLADGEALADVEATATAATAAAAAAAAAAGAAAAE